VDEPLLPGEDVYYEVNVRGRHVMLTNSRLIVVGGKEITRINLREVRTVESGRELRLYLSGVILTILGLSLAWIMPYLLLLIAAGLGIAVYARTGSYSLVITHREGRFKVRGDRREIMELTNELISMLETIREGESRKGKGVTRERRRQGNHRTRKDLEILFTTSVPAMGDNTSIESLSDLPTTSFTPPNSKLETSVKCPTRHCPRSLHCPH